MTTMNELKVDSDSVTNIGKNKISLKDFTLRLHEFTIR